MMFSFNFDRHKINPIISSGDKPASHTVVWCCTFTVVPALL